MMRKTLVLVSLVAASLVAIRSAAAQMNDPWPGMKKLLVVADVRMGYHHDSINHAMGVIEQLGRESGQWVTVLRTDAQLVTKQEIVGVGTRYSGRRVNAHNLNFFDGIFILSSGAGSLDDQQKSDLLSFVKDDGKGLILGHAASVAYYEWPEFFDVIGAFMKSEYHTGVARLIRESTAFPGASAFPEHFTYEDQFAVMEDNFSSDDAEVILRLDASEMTDEQMKERDDHDFPLAWAKTYGNGRVFNQTIGHREEVWDDPKFRTLMTGAIEWALGITHYDVAYPNAD